MARASLETQQAVYLALRGVFTGEVARLREKKAIRRIVKAHEGDIDLLVKKYTLEGVVGVARSLVLEEVFESELKAKERFPTAFKDAVVSNADEAPEQAGTMSEHEVSDKAHTCRRCGSSDTVIIADSIGLQEVDNSARNASSRPPEGAPPNEWLFPIFLPFETQHTIMNELQRTLECVCFAYGQRFLPGLLKSRRWTCAAAVELNRWTDEFQQRPDLFLKSSTMSADELGNLFKSISYIRQVSVHRIDISATRLDQCVEDAQKLADLLQSYATAEAIERLRAGIRVETERLEKERTSLLQKFASLQQGIASDRRALDQKEEKAIAAVEEQDAGYLKRVGEGIQNAIFDFQLTKTIVPAVDSSDKAVDDADIVIC